MRTAREQDIERFIKHVGYWSWIHVLYTYDESHLLIADEWFLDQVRSARPEALSCKTARPESYKQAITPDVQKVLVFCSEGELNLVRDIQANHPNLHVTSGTYGYACIGKDRYPRLKEYLPPEVNKDPKPVFIITTPYADGEFLSKIMELNGMPPTCEYLGRAFSTWLSFHKNFQVGRYYNTVVRHYAKQGQLSWLLQTDVLQSVFENTSYNLKRFIRDLQKLGAKVILVSRKSNWVQSVTAQLMHRTTERSVWTKSPNKKILSVREDGDVFGCMDWGEFIREGEAYIEEIEEKIPACLHFKLDDFIDDQPGGIHKITELIGADLPDAIETLDYASGYETAPNVQPLSIRLQREFMDKLGIHISTQI